MLNLHGPCILASLAILGLLHLAIGYVWLLSHLVNQFHKTDFYHFKLAIVKSSAFLTVGSLKVRFWVIMKLI